MAHPEFSMGTRPGRIGRGLIWALAAVFGLNFLTGLACLLPVWLHPEDPPPYGWIRAHGWTVPPVLVLLGILAPVHMCAAWKAGRNAASGALLAGWMIAMTVSGFGLYYAGSEGLRAMCKWVHVAGGLALPAAAAAHIWLGRAR